MIPIAKPMIGPDERAAVDRVLSSGGLSQGAEVAAFESEFSVLVGGRACVAVNSGTSALHIGLVAAGIGRGDEVIVPSFTFAATANAVVLAGATPIFADIDPDTWCLDPVSVASRLSTRTAAILPVHLYGQLAPMTELCRLADRAGLLIIEDAAQAHSAALDCRPAGAWGSVAAFSFYPTKNMTTGEGGMMVTDDPKVERTARLLRNQGMETQYENEIAGFNLRMTDMAAAIGRVQLRRLEGFTRSRQMNAIALTNGLASSSIARPPVVRELATHVYHQYTVRCEDRPAVQAALAAAGVDSRVYYPIPVHQLPAYAQQLDLPNTAAAALEVLSLPVGPHVGHAEIDQMLEALR